MKKISIKELLDAGVHFGHRTNRWNPKCPNLFLVIETAFI